MKFFRNVAARKPALPLFLLLALVLSSCASRSAPPAPPPAARRRPRRCGPRPSGRRVSRSGAGRDGCRSRSRPPRATLTPEASLWFSAFKRALRTALPAEADAWKVMDGCQVRPRPLGGRPACRGLPRRPRTRFSRRHPRRRCCARSGDPPPLSAALVPRRYVIALDDGPPLTYTAPIAISAPLPVLSLRRRRHFGRRIAEGDVGGGTRRADAGGGADAIRGACGRGRVAAGRRVRRREYLRHGLRVRRLHPVHHGGGR